MGIKNLNTLIKKYGTKVCNVVKLESLRGKRVGVDISIFLYKYMYGYRGDILLGFTRMIQTFQMHGITPIFIYDGEPPREKTATLQGRIEKREDMKESVGVFTYAWSVKQEMISNPIDKRALLLTAEMGRDVDVDVDVSVSASISTSISAPPSDFSHFKKKMEAYSESISAQLPSEKKMRELYEKTSDELYEKASKIERSIILVTAEHIRQTKELFDAHGIQYVHEACEAEALMAVLCHRGLLDACISEDSDVLVNGGTILLRGFSTERDSVDQYDLSRLLQCLKLTHDEFIDMCILCGCDYTEKIYNMGPMTALKMIQQHKTLESVLENLHDKKYGIPEGFDYIGARQLFKNPVSNEILERMNAQFPSK